MPAIPKMTVFGRLIFSDSYGSNVKHHPYNANHHYSARFFEQNLEKTEEDDLVRVDIGHGQSS